MTSANAIPMPVNAEIAMRTAKSAMNQNAAGKTDAASDTSELDKVKKSAQDFEAVFLSEMMGHMFEGLEPNKEFGGGQGEKMFQGMMVQEYGKMMAKGQGIGISQQLQSVMLRMQEQHQSV